MHLFFLNNSYPAGMHQLANATISVDNKNHLIQPVALKQIKNGDFIWLRYNASPSLASTTEDDMSKICEEIEKESEQEQEQDKKINKKRKRTTSSRQSNTVK
jgi:hypothetical protein